MKGSECRLIEYMEGSKKRFIIPVYQRNYDWKTENCKQLYDDLVKVIKNNRRSHFLGSLVSVYEPSGRNTEFLVIDGQQRLTTVSLLFLAMYNLISNGITVPEDASLGKQIYEDFLVDKYQTQDTRIKLKPVKNDQKAFGKLFDSEDEHIRESNLTMNYNYFYDRIQKQEITIDQLFDAICSLEIINITLNNEDNPQLIFESLNSTGLDLSEGDKIRNFILMGLPAKEQDEYYEKYWNRIEECTKYDVSSFVRDYLSVKQLVIPSQKKIYISFKEYVELSLLGVEELLKDLLAYAKRYEILLNGNTKNKALDSCINRLNRLETTVTRPFFLEVLRLNNEGKLDISQVTDIFLITENYLFRRTICDLPTNALNKIFLKLHREIIRYDGTDANYVEKFKYALLSKKEKARFPDDDEFATQFTERQVYQMNSKNKIYILERLENYGTAEDKDVYSHCDDGTYSIEHIMPQHLTPAWVKALGDDYEQIHETWLHRIANLTLTAYNSKYSNAPFSEKKTMEDGYLQSGIRMTQWVAQKEHWGLPELEERCKYLTQQAMSLWPYADSSYTPPQKQYEEVSLDDDITLTGHSIVKYRFRGIEHETTSWVEMYTEVLKELHNGNKAYLNYLADADDSVDLSIQVTRSPDEFSSSVKIDDNIYIWTGTATQYKVNLLRKFFEQYKQDPSDLVFFLDDSKGIGSDEEIERYKIRRKYWESVLPSLQEATGTFLNISPSKNNSIMGATARSGVYLCCVANYDSARVEIFIDQGDYQKNRAIYKRLEQNRDAIEAAYGKSLNWVCQDDVRACKVYDEIKEVSIKNEEDRPVMSAFHIQRAKALLVATKQFLA